MNSQKPENILNFLTQIIALIAALISLWLSVNSNGLSKQAVKTSDQAAAKSDQAVKASDKSSKQISGLENALSTIYGKDVYAVATITTPTTISALLQGRKPPAPPLPDGLDHINGFLEKPISTGEGLKAETFKEAWVMAYIEKHQGEFEYGGNKIYTYGDLNAKRDAIIKLVKEQGADSLFNSIAPPVTTP